MVEIRAESVLVCQSLNQNVPGVELVLFASVRITFHLKSDLGVVVEDRETNFFFNCIRGHAG